MIVSTTGAPSGLSISFSLLQTSLYSIVKGGMVTVKKKLSGISGMEKGRDNLYSDAYRGKSVEKVPVLCRWLAEGFIARHGC